MTHPVNVAGRTSATAVRAAEIPLRAEAPANAAASMAEQVQPEGGQHRKHDGERQHGIARHVHDVGGKQPRQPAGCQNGEPADFPSPSRRLAWP